MPDSDSPSDQAMECYKEKKPAEPVTGKATAEAERRNAEDDSARGSKSSKVDRNKGLFAWLMKKKEDKAKK